MGGLPRCCCLEAARQDHQGFDTDHVKVFLSVCSCFAALAGQPRIFVGVVYESAAEGSWKIDIVQCKVSPQSSASWQNISQEIMTLISSGMDLSVSLCGATCVASLKLQDNWEIQKCDLAEEGLFSAIHKELFGWRKVQSKQ